MTCIIDLNFGSTYVEFAVFYQFGALTHRTRARARRTHHFENKQFVHFDGLGLFPLHTKLLHMNSVIRCHLYVIRRHSYSQFFIQFSCIIHSILAILHCSRLNLHFNWFYACKNRKRKQMTIARCRHCIHSQQFHNDATQKLLL